MNKKGALFHWIAIVVIFALAFAFLSPTEFGVKPKGTWQLDFLHHRFIEAEKTLADNDELALQVGRKTVLELAEKGGFAESPECGWSAGITYWNKPQNFCFLPLDESINTAFNNYYKKYDKNANFVISRNGKELIGKTGKEVLIGKEDAEHYVVNSGFRVDLNYNFDEYFILQDQAKKVVDECRAALNLSDCLGKVKPDHWKFGSCLTENFTEDERKISFCVGSPAEYTVLEQGQFVPVEYKFGLDFGMN